MNIDEKVAFISKVRSTIREAIEEAVTEGLEEIYTAEMFEEDAFQLFAEATQFDLRTYIKEIVSDFFEVAEEE